MAIMAEGAADVLQAHARELRDLGVRSIGLFGSILGPDYGPDSDVDVYVELDPARKTYDNFFELHELLSGLFGRRIDLVTDGSLSKHLAPRILPSIRYVSLGT